MLSDALDAGIQQDFQRLHEQFGTFLKNIGAEWGSEYPATRRGTRTAQRTVAQEYRISLMGLGGRAITLAEAGRIADPNAYLDVARNAHIRPSLLGNDVAQAMLHQGLSGLSLWSDWETEGSPNGVVHSIEPNRYPLTFFSLRLMELSTSPIQTLDLQGHARQVHQWFVKNSERLERFLNPDPTTANRGETARAALEAAIHRDEVTEGPGDHTA